MTTLIIIGNYPPDGQRSMEAATAIFRRIGEEMGFRVGVWIPLVCFGHLCKLPAGLRKYLAYLDKYLLTPLTFRFRWWRLRRSITTPVLVHIADHSNAIYAPCFRKANVLLTCHDLIALRKAMGEFSEQSPVGFLGKMQQRWIAKHLGRIEHLAFVSNASKGDFQRLIESTPETATVIPNCLHPAFRQQSKEQIAAIFQTHSIGLSSPYLHAHGGGVWYKNRPAILEIFLRCRRSCPELRLVVSGESLEPELSQRLAEAEALEALTETGPVPIELLAALYASASVFLFPSWIEGFGWPPLEAQACGCPVVASNAGSLREVLADSCPTFAPSDITGMSEAVLAILRDSTLRKSVISRGLVNAQRFTYQETNKGYSELYRHLSNRTN